MSQAEDSERLPQRSEQFYYTSGDIVILVELTLYRLHCDILSKFSIVFKDILSVPNGKEGAEDCRPLVLETIKRVDWDRLMGWIYNADLRHTPPGGGERTQFLYETLVSILKLSTLYQMTVARNWAIERIEAEDSITAVQRMHLAQQYSVPKWILPAVAQLLQRPLLSLSSDEVELLTPSVVVVLAKAQAKWQEALLSLAYAAPGIPHALHCCFGDRARCSAVWVETWWTKVARYLLNPAEQPKLSLLCDYIEALPSLDNMTITCKLGVLEDLRTSRALRIDTIILEKAVAAIEEIHSRYIVAYYTSVDN